MLEFRLKKKQELKQEKSKSPYMSEQIWTSLEFWFQNDLIHD